MKRVSRGKVAITGIIVSVFVVLMGVVSYTRLLNSTSEVAVKSPGSSNSGKLAAPTIHETSDLDKAISTLDSAQLDDDLETLSTVANQL